MHCTIIASVSTFRRFLRVLRILEDPPWTQLRALPEGWEGTPWGEGVAAEHKPSRGGGGYPHGGRSYLPGGWVGTPMGNHWVRYM